MDKSTLIALRMLNSVHCALVRGINRIKGNVEENSKSLIISFPFYWNWNCRCSVQVEWTGKECWNHDCWGWGKSIILSVIVHVLAGSDIVIWSYSVSLYPHDNGVLFVPSKALYLNENILLSIKNFLHNAFIRLIRNGSSTSNIQKEVDIENMST